MLAALLLAVSVDKTFTLYVSPVGEDSWSGTLRVPNRERSDGPLGTIQAARDKLRSLPKSEPATVKIAGGIYEVQGPIEFGPEDSGSVGAPRVYEGPTSGKPAVITGMTPVIGWRTLPSGFLQATIPEVAEGKRYFSQLYIGGQRRFRPRLPKNGYYAIKDKAAPSAAAVGHGFDRFAFNSGEIRPEWVDSDTEILAIHQWTMSRNKIADVDTIHNIVTFKSPTGYNDSWADFLKGHRFLIENAKDALSKPGEWYLDRKSGELTYIPLPGETEDDVHVQAPIAESLLHLKGDVASRKWVQFLTFAGLTFEGTNWNTPAGGRHFAQAEVDLRGALNFDGARDCKITNCEIHHVGTYAVDIGGACKRIEIEKNEMEDLGAGGVKIGETALQSDPELITEHCDVRSNLILGGGRVHPAAVGVWIGQNPYNIVSDNVIKDFYYTGVSVGWSWGYAPAGAHDNLIENNRISQIGQGVLSDMGGIYTLGLQKGTILRGNRIHDVKCRDYGGWGIYTDEGSSNILIENNCVFRCSSANFHQHYGEANVLTNNVWAFGGDFQLMRTRQEDHLSFIFENNIVLLGDTGLLGSNWSDNNYKLDKNLYWRIGGKPLEFAGINWGSWQAKGQDVNSAIADPMFVDPVNNDYRLEKNSLALRMGFRPFPALDPGFEPKIASSTPPAFGE